jgi:hypothetical protein
MAHAFISKVSQFIETPREQLTDKLNKVIHDGGFEINIETAKSWDESITWLKESLHDIAQLDAEARDWSIVMEYVIPVIRKRIDILILTKNKILVIEFKSGSSATAKQALNQAKEYVGSLQDFHEESHGRKPVAIALGNFKAGHDLARAENGLIANRETLTAALQTAAACGNTEADLDHLAWIASRYAPIPGIIEFASLIFQGQTVEDLNNSKAGDENIRKTRDAVLKAAKDAKREGKKKLVIITGVPGAGKTLAGLNARLAIQKAGILDKNKEHAAFLSGNRPLVTILQEVIRRDHLKKQATEGETGKKGTKGKTKAAISQIIGHMHEYIEDTYEGGHIPSARILIFDEAQRAWDEEKMQKWQKKKRTASSLKPEDWKSEPETVLRLMSRHEDWALVVILAGTGQEIHKGEAGMQGWGEAAKALPNWEVVAPRIAVEGRPNVANSSLFKDKRTPDNFLECEDLYLKLSTRTILAGETDTSKWADALLAGKSPQAKACIVNGLPIFVTRDLNDARSRLRALEASSNKQIGMIASSGAARLIADGVQPPTFAVMQRFKYHRWFLDTAPNAALAPEGTIAETESYHSSRTLESAVSEFEIQGLELRIPLLLWGGDLIFTESGEPIYRKLSESECRWNTCADDDIEASDDDSTPDEPRSNRISNKYRVLLTRFREALVVFIPKGDAKDPTLNPKEFDAVYRHFINCGATDLKDTDWPRSSR